MSTRKLIVPLLLLFALLNTKFQCDKGDAYQFPEIAYQFKEPVTITPYQLDYKVGDTVWLSVNIPDKRLLDTLTNTRVRYDSASFTTAAQVELLYNNPFIATGPFARFVFPPGVTAYVNSGSASTYAQITYGCAPSPDYRLLLGVVLIEKGVFGLSLFNSSILQCFTNSYRNAMLTYAFDVADTHKAYYQQLPFSNIGKQPEGHVLERLNRKAMVVINVQ
jgi:hypothetical protein